MVLATAAPALAASPYVVGVPLPETGAEAAMGTDMFQAMKLAAAQINAQGGVLGHKIQLIEEDSACDPQTSVNAANKLVALKVQAVVGTYCSSAALPAEPIFERAGLPFVMPDANATDLTANGFKDVFQANANGQAQANTASFFLVKILKAKRIAIVDDQSEYAVNLATLTQKAIAKLHGNVVDVEAVPATTQDFSSLINKLQSENVDAVYWTGYYAQGGLLIKQARQHSFKSQILVADGSVDNILITTAGAKNAQGVYATMTPMPPFLTGAAATAFTKAYTSRFHMQPGPYSALAYDSIKILATAATRAKSIAPAKVITALHAVNYTGITGPISFSSNGVRHDAHFLVLMVKNGKFTLAPVQPKF